MNRQVKRRNGQVVSRGIEWTDYTWNPIGGCFHNCRWEMPDGSVADCYAKDTAEGIASAAYPHGFEHHYFHLDRLTEPLSVKKPSKIFLDSMSDLMGHWVPDNEIALVFNAIDNAHWHTFQLLTKNPKRLLAFRNSHSLPRNLWIGASMPPDWMWTSRVPMRTQGTMLHKALDTLAQLHNNVTWMSFEPLSWDVSDIVDQYPFTLDWAVIGAATNGRQAYQPDPQHVESLIDVLDYQSVPVFFKGNLEWEPRREEWPAGVAALEDVANST